MKPVEDARQRIEREMREFIASGGTVREVRAGETSAVQWTGQQPITINTTDGMRSLTQVQRAKAAEARKARARRRGAQKSAEARKQ